MSRLAAIPLALFALVAPAWAAEVIPVDTPGVVRQIIETPRGTFVETAGGTFRIESCEDGAVCLKRSVIRGLPKRNPADALPDGWISTASTGDIRRAWYSSPTRRYGHGVLGDAVEAGVLMAKTRTGAVIKLELPKSHVFEDLAPRIADLDGDGRNEIVCIRSSLTGGAAVAIYGLQNKELVLKDSSPEIGRANRWLNIAGIAEYLGDGRKVVAWVETPHIGGRLKMAVFDGVSLRSVAKNRDGFSNHVIGSRELGLSATRYPGAGRAPQLVLPSADRSKLVLIDRHRMSSIAVPGHISHRIAAVGQLLVTATENGKLLAIRP